MAARYICNILRITQRQQIPNKGSNQAHFHVIVLFGVEGSAGGVYGRCVAPRREEKGAGAFSSFRSSTMKSRGIRMAVPMDVPIAVAKKLIS